MKRWLLLTFAALVFAAPLQAQQCRIDPSDNNHGPGLVDSRFAPYLVESVGSPSGAAVNIKDCGAQCNGVTDDTQPIQLAMNVLIKASGGVLLVPVGTCLVSNNIIDFPLATSSIHLIIRGMGWGSIVKQTNTTFNIFFVANAGSVSLEDIQLNGNWSSGNGNNCFRSDINDTRVRNVRFINCGQNGLFWNAVNATPTTRLTFQGNHCYKVGLGAIGGWCLAVQSGQNISVVNNVADSCGAGLVDFEPTTATAIIKNATVTGNTVNNTIGNIPTTGSIQAFGGNVTTQAVGNMAWSGNVVDNAGLNCFRFADVRNLTINGNTCRAPKANGVLATAVNNPNQMLAIVGNTIVTAGAGAGNTFDALNLSFVQDGIVEGNTLNDTGSVTRRYVTLDANSTRMKVVNNTWSRAPQTATISNLSTNPCNGSATLVAGTVTVATTCVFTGAIIQVDRQASGGTLGILSVGTIVSGTSFIINSSNAADVSVVYWEIKQ